MDMIQIGQYIVGRWAIIGTSTVIHAVYEPTTLMVGDERGHGTIITRTVDGRVEWLGRVGTRRLPAAVEQLRGDERSAMYRIIRSAQHELAYQLIVEAFPETADGRREDGEIVLTSVLANVARMLATGGRDTRSAS